MIKSEIKQSLEHKLKEHDQAPTQITKKAGKRKNNHWKAKVTANKKTHA